MQQSTFATVSVNAVGDKTATILASAPSTTPMRVEVRNIGGAIVFLATAPGDVNPQTGPSAGAYRLPAGQSAVFVIQPKQNLNSIAVGAGAMVSVAVSEAITYGFGG